MAQSDGASPTDLGLTPRIQQEAEAAGIDVADILGDSDADAPVLSEARPDPQPEASADTDGKPDGKQDEATEDRPAVEAAPAEPASDSAPSEGESIETRLAALEQQLGQARNENRTLQAEKDRHLTRVKDLEQDVSARQKQEQEAHLERLGNMSELEKAQWVDQQLAAAKQPQAPADIEKNALATHYENRLRALRGFYPEGDKGTQQWQDELKTIDGPDQIDGFLIQLAEKRATRLNSTDREAQASAAAATTTSSDNGVVDTGATPGRKVASYDQLAADYADPDSDFGRDESDLDVVLEAAKREGKKFLSQYI